MRLRLSLHPKMGRAHQLRSFPLDDLMDPLERHAEELGALAQRVTVDIVGHDLGLMMPTVPKVPASPQVAAKVG
jgi:hypothetical protein